MIRDVVSFEKVWRRLNPKANRSTSILTFIRFLEKKFDFEAVYDETLFLHGRYDLVDLFQIAERLQQAGVIQSFHRNECPPDEPRLSFWGARYRDTPEECFSGGSALDDDRHALVCALAEGLERHIWFERDDYFVAPFTATVSATSTRRKILAPERFAGFSDLQRKENKALALSDEKEYLWIRAHSLTEAGHVWLPAQTVSASATVHARRKIEPLIRRIVTTGLSTHPDRTQALLSGALEIIERDAYIITWLNQITPTRISIDDLCATNDKLARLVARCKQYRLRPHIIRFPTDAPAYAIGGVIEDETGHAPRISLGLKAHADPAIAAEKALIEALRARRYARNNAEDKPVSEKKGSVGHYDRIQYWARPENDTKLQFLISGNVLPLTEEPWQRDATAQHLDRIVTWCKEKKYACVSVPFTHSKANVTPWHIEMVVIPELQPLHYSESLPHIGGTRIRDVPTQSGYPPRHAPFTDEPHPFA